MLGEQIRIEQKSCVEGRVDEVALHKDQALFRHKDFSDGRSLCPCLLQL